MLIESDVTANGETASITHTTVVLDGSEVPFVALSTNNSLSWSSKLDDWTSAGNITLASSTLLGDFAEWDSEGSFGFKEGNCSVYVSDKNLDGRTLFLTKGRGQYTGDWNHW